MSRIRIQIVALMAAVALPTGSSAEVFFRTAPHVIEDVKQTPPPSGTPANALVLNVSGVLAAGGVLAYGQDWDTAFTAGGDKEGYAFVLSPGALPPGLSLVEDGPVLKLKGRARNGSYGPYEVTVRDADGKTATRTVPAFAVAPASTPFRIDPPTSIRFPKGRAWSASFAGAGGLAPYDLTGGTVTGSGSVERRTVTASGTDAVGAMATSSPVTIQVGDDASLSAPAVNGIDVSSSGVAAERTLTVTNNGDFPTASAPSVSIATGPFAVVDQTCGAVLAAGRSCEARIRTSATAPGPVSGTATVAGLAGSVALDGTVATAGGDSFAFLAPGNRQIVEARYGASAKVTKCLSSPTTVPVNLMSKCGAKPYVMVVSHAGVEFGYGVHVPIAGNYPGNYAAFSGFVFSSYGWMSGKAFGQTGASVGTNASKVEIYLGGSGPGNSGADGSVRPFYFTSSGNTMTERSSSGSWNLGSALTGGGVSTGFQPTSITVYNVE